MKSMNRGSSSVASIAALVVAGAMIAMLSGCGGGGGGGGGGAGAGSANVAVSGNVVFNGNALANKVVTALQGGTVLSTTTTDGSGNYALTVPANTSITLEVQENIGCSSVTQEPVDYSKSVNSGTSATLVEDLTIPTNQTPPSAPVCS